MGTIFARARHARSVRECRWTAASLSELIDGELGPLSRLRIRLHLLSCAMCQQVLGNLRAVVGVLRSGAIASPAPAMPDPTLAAERMAARWRAEHG